MGIWHGRERPQAPTSLEPRPERVKMGAEPDLAEDEMEALHPVHPDVLLITDYLTNELSPEADRDVERRLVADPEFFESVWGILFAWCLPDDIRLSLTRSIERSSSARNEGADDATA